MPQPPAKPTVTETSLAERRAMVERHAAGESYQQIATALGWSRRTVIRWVTRERREGAAGLAYHSHRPHRPHPATVAPAIVDRIAAIRRAHPGWGARLIQHQLQIEQVDPIPHERTIQHWLGRLGFPSLRQPAAIPLGWQVPVPAADEAVWQIDFKAIPPPGAADPPATDPPTAAAPAGEKGGAGS